MNSLFVSLVQSDVLHQKKEKKSMLQQILQNFSFARGGAKIREAFTIPCKSGDLLSSGIAEAFSFYNPLKWALFSRNRSNVGCKEKEKGA